MKLITVMLTLLLLAPAAAEVTMQGPAPAFKLTGHDGKTYQLRDLKGKPVVLEWYNQGCPFVRKHYDAGHMQALQAEFKDRVTWLTITSSVAGKQGYLETPAQALQQFQKEGMKSQALLLDGVQGGSVGRQFGAITTPHLFIIDGAGKLVYNGAIDDRPSTESADIPGATPLFKNALQALLKGEAIPRAKNDPYGCSVKY